MTSNPGRSAEALTGAQWDGNTLVIDNPDALKRIFRREISPSAASGLRKCEASFAADSVLPRHSDPFQPFVLGTADHEVMEHLFQLPPEERVPDFVHPEVARLRDKTFSPEALEEPERRRMLMPEASPTFVFDTTITDELVAANDSAKARWEAIVLPWALGIFNMTDQPHPREIDVFGTELAVGGWDFENKRPHETKLNLAGLQGEFPVQGKIDRTRWATLESGQRVLVVDDYKFPGKKPGKPKDDYSFQQRTYVIMIRALYPDMPVVGANLLYPGWNKVSPIDTSDQAIHSTLRMFEHGWLAMNRAVDSHRFSTRPSNLCGWCPLANACPVAKVGTENAAANAATQPSGKSLGITVARPHNRVSAWAQNSDYSRLPAPGITNGGQLADRGAPADAASAAQPVPAVEQSVQTATNGADLVPVNVVRIPVGAVHREGYNHNAAPAADTKAIEMSAPGTIAAPATELAAPFKFPASPYGPMATFSLVDTATEHLAAQGQQITPSAINALATTLAAITFGITRDLFGGAGWEHASFGRVLFSVKASITLRPAPFGGDANTWRAWEATITGLTMTKASLAMGLLEGNTFDPNAAASHFAPVPVTG